MSFLPPITNFSGQRFENRHELNGQYENFHMKRTFEEIDRISNCIISKTLQQELPIEEKNQFSVTLFNIFQNYAIDLLKEYNDPVKNLQRISIKQNQHHIPSIKYKEPVQHKFSVTLPKTEKITHESNTTVSTSKFERPRVKIILPEIPPPEATTQEQKITLESNEGSSSPKPPPFQPNGQSNSPRSKTHHFTRTIENFPQKVSSKEKIQRLLTKAQKGDSDSQYTIGACYSLGEGIQQDSKKALDFYLLAAKQGHKKALFNAASCFSYGRGTEIDKERAFGLYLEAAEQGYDKAQFAVGHFYEFGIGGVEPDHEKALEWYKKAAEQGHKGAISAIED